MLRLQFTEASRFQNALLKENFLIPLKKSKLFIGRGDQLSEMENNLQGIIDLSTFDNTLSRVHACFNFSPAWFMKESDIQIPTYLSLLSNKCPQLSTEVIDKIWEYLKPKKSCILKDLKSKIGTFKRITSSEEIKSQMTVEFVLHSQFKFHYYEQYSSLQELERSVKWAKQKDQSLIILGDLNKIKQNIVNCSDRCEEKQILRAWKCSAKEDHFFLLIQQSLILRIGRSSHCQIQIKDAAISRYQAYLKCQNRKWKIYDGNQLQASKNGTWLKCKSIPIPISMNQSATIKTSVKIGTIKCQIELIQCYRWLNLKKIFNDEKSQSFIELGIQSKEQQQERQKAQKVIKQQQETSINDKIVNMKEQNSEN